jgi:hypothetical protein
MRRTIINILAILVGVLIGGIVNMAIVTSGSFLIAPPQGADLTTEKGLLAAMPLMEPKHFLMPFLAHAIGSFVAAYLATRFSKTKARRVPTIVAALFFIGGLMDILQLHAPIWFSCIDLALAYFPMAFLAYKWAKRD